MLGRFWIGAAENKGPIRILCLRRPDLLAGDAEIIAIFDSAGLQGGQIRARVGLGVTLAPDLFAINDLGNEALFLLLCAPMHQGWPDQTRPRADERNRCINPLKLLMIDNCL